jgi:hypothetical protein
LAAGNALAFLAATVALNRSCPIRRGETLLRTIDDVIRPVGILTTRVVNQRTTAKALAGICDADEISNAQLH